MFYRSLEMPYTPWTFFDNAREIGVRRALREDMRQAIYRNSIATDDFIDGAILTTTVLVAIPLALYELARD